MTSHFPISTPDWRRIAYAAMQAKEKFGSAKCLSGI
jgi:hypothetical protein